MDLENILLTRREILRGGSVLGLRILADSLLPLEAATQVHSPQSRLIDSFKRYPPYDIQKLELKELKAHGTRIVRTPEEIALDRDKIRRQYPLLREEPQLVTARRELWVRFEPDREYARRLSDEATISLNHFADFIGRTRFGEHSIKLLTPKKESDVARGDDKTIPVYLVADFLRKIIVRYSINLGGIQQFVEAFYEEKPYGSDSTLIQKGNDGRVTIDFGGMPVFYNISAPVTHLLVTPATEVLHRFLARYTISNAAREQKRVFKSGKGIDVTYVEHSVWEEKFVHGLVDFWFREYNKHRNLGLNDRDIDAMTTSLEKTAKYVGAGKLSRYISSLDTQSSIAVQKAINLYANNPDLLFRSAGLK